MRRKQSKVPLDGGKPFFSAIKENRGVLSLPSLVGLSALSLVVSPQTGRFSLL